MSSGKIYRLVFPGGYYYIGSTTKELSSRFKEHQRKAKLYPDRKVYKKATEVGWESVKIEKFGNEEFTDEANLRLTESVLVEEALDDKLCLNCKRVFVTQEQAAYTARECGARYDSQHKEERRQARRERYRLNAESERQKQREYYARLKEIKSQ